MPAPERAPGADSRWAQRWGVVIIALAVLLVYWPLSSFAYGLTEGDTLDCWMPWRWFIAQALQDGHFPLWNPYTQSGYPIYADLQGPAWYPPSIALAGTVGHSLYTLQALFLAYVIIGGVGFMRLVRQRGTDARIALVVGLAYALGGFFTAHQMHFYAVISAAWLPWLLAAQIRLCQAPAWRPAVEAAVFQALLLTGGNHTFTLINAWLLLALFTVHLVRARHQRPLVLRMVRNQLLFGALTLLMACGTIYAWWEVSPFLSRAHGMTYAAAAKNPFTLHAAWSLLFPYATGTDGLWLGTDPAMANGYTGVLVLLLAAFAFLGARSVVENTIAVFGLVCLLASFGDALPVHHWLWASVPGMNLFRFPSYFQWFFSMAVLLLAAGALARWPQWSLRRLAVAKALIAITALLVAVCLARAWAMHVYEPPFGVGDTRYEKLTGIWRWHRVLVVAPVTWVALVGFWYWVGSLRQRWALLLVLVAIEMGWATFFAQWNTAIGDYSPAMLQGRIDEMPRGPVWPELRPMGMNTDGSAQLKHIWRNVQDFEGKPSHHGFNSFWLNDANRLADEHPALLAAMERQPLVYLSDRLLRPDQYHPADVDPARDSALVVLQGTQLQPATLHHLPTDSLAVVGFSPDGVALATHTTHPVFALLQQAWYPGWSATVDGNAVEIIRANIACFGVVLPAGNHLLEFRFEKPVVAWLLGLSLSIFLGACFLLAATSTSAAPKAGVVLLASAIIWSLFAHRPKAERLPRSVRAMVAKLDVVAADTIPLLVNTGRFPALQEGFRKHPAIPLRAEDRSRTEAVQRACMPFAHTPFWWLDAGLPTAPAVRSALLARFHVDTMLQVGDVTAVLLLPGADEKQDTLLHQYTGGAGQWLNAATPWTAAFREEAGKLRQHAPGALVVQAAYQAIGRSIPTVVIERRRGSRITNYEAFPLPMAAGSHVAYVVRDLRELRYPDEEVGIYLWNNGADSMRVDSFSVHLFRGEMGHW